MLSRCCTWQRRLYINGVLPHLQLRCRCWLCHVLDETQLILPAYLFLSTLVLLEKSFPLLLVHLLPLLSNSTHAFLDLLPLMHLLQLCDLLNLL